MVRWVPSQNGLLFECPQRHIANWSGWGISRPSGAVRCTGPDTRYGPFSLGVMVTSAMVVVPLSVDCDGLAQREPADSGARERRDGIRQGGGNGRDTDLADARWSLPGLDHVHLDRRFRLHPSHGVAVEVLGDDVASFAQDDLTPGRGAQP